MADDSFNEMTMPPAAEPNLDLSGLQRLVGTWEVSGGAEGTTTFEWMKGGFFMMQRVQLVQAGQVILGLEIIGHEQDFGSEPGEDIRSCFYDNLGNTLRYVYEVDGNTLTIWGGEKGSPAFYRGSFSSDGNRLDGAWTYPGGGGYESRMTRSNGVSNG